MALFNLDATTGALTFKASPDYEAPGSAAGSNTYTVKIKASDAESNSAVQTVTITVTDVDDTAPVFTSATTASVAENTTTVVYDANATDNGGDTDVGITYSMSGDDAGLFTLDKASGEIKFIERPNYEAPKDANGDNIYNLTLTATDVAGNATRQSLTLSVTDVVGDSKAGQSVIDLGEYGKLIAPVFVDEKWYYAWDMNGDGVHNGGTQNTTGKWDADGSVVNTTGTGFQYDIVTHDVLDGIFTQDVNGNTGGGGNTDNTYRFTEINGVKLALPTLGDSSLTQDYRPGTAIDNSLAGETNQTYDDLLAIWDAYNGSGTGTKVNGLPPGWGQNWYWSASSPSMDRHSNLSLTDGFANYISGDGYRWMCVAVQVLSDEYDETAPVFSVGATVSVSIAENTSTVVYTSSATDNMAITGYALAGGADDRLFTLDATTGALTFKAAPDYEALGSTDGTNAYTVKIKASDAAGNSAIQIVTVNVTDVDEKAPTAVLTAASIANNGEATVQSSEVGTAYLVKNTLAVSSLADITSADENQWNSVAIGTVNSDTQLSVANLLSGVYKLYTADAAGNLSAVASNTSLVTNTTDANTINLAEIGQEDYGQLIAPVYVDGKWYAAWDMNGDGVHSYTQDTAGKYDSGESVANSSGTGYQYDYMYHDVLDGIFTKDINGNLNPGTDTTDTYRYTILNDVNLALPTIGDGGGSVARTYQANGTNSQAGEINSTYDDLLAIWDAFNGRPEGWQNHYYWAAEPAMHSSTPPGIESLSLGRGGVWDAPNGNYDFFATLQVL